MFCWSLFVLSSFFLWPLCCLFFCDIRILKTLWYLQTLFIWAMNKKIWNYLLHGHSRFEIGTKTTSVSLVSFHHDFGFNMSNSVWEKAVCIYFPLGIVNLKCSVYLFVYQTFSREPPKEYSFNIRKQSSWLFLWRCLEFQPFRMHYLEWQPCSSSIQHQRFKLCITIW